MATQIERRAATRAVLLDAAGDVLVEHGLGGFTTSAVSGRAGLSNGALFGHFPTRLELIAATVEHVLARLRVEYDRTFSSLLATGSHDRTDGCVAVDPETALELLWVSMSDPQFCAVLEAYTQARTDADLATAIEPIVTEHSVFVSWLVDRVVAAIAVSAEAEARLRPFGDAVILAMQGLTIRLMGGPVPGADRELIERFASLAASINESAGQGVPR